MINKEEVAEKVSAELDEICKKYNCEIGVWLGWRDLLHNFDIMKQDPKINELHFGLQMRIPDEPTNKTKKRNKGAD